MSKSTAIIGLIGHKGSGKDTAALALQGYTIVKMAGALKFMLEGALRPHRLDDEATRSLIEGDLKETPSNYVTGEFLTDEFTRKMMIAALLKYQGVSNVRITFLFKNAMDRQLAELEGHSIQDAMFNLKRVFSTHLSPGPNTMRRVMQILGTEWGRECLNEDVWVNICMRQAQLCKPAAITDIRFHNEANALEDGGFLLLRITRPGLAVDLSHPSEQQIASLYHDEEIINGGSVAELHSEVRRIVTAYNSQS